MQDLHGDQPAGLMHVLGDLPVIGDVLRIVEPRGAGKDGAFAVGCHAAGHDQTHAALGPARIKPCGLGPVAPLLQPGMHGAHQNPALQGQVAKGQRGKKMRVEAPHGILLAQDGERLCRCHARPVPQEAA